MCLRVELSKMTTAELRELKPKLNLTNDEELVFDYLSKGKSNTQISMDICLSLATVGNRISAIKKKIARVKYD